MLTLTRGVLIAIEGIDGSGKSTLAKNLVAALTADMLIVLTQEPGKTPLGMKLRAILQQQDVPLCPKAEYLLFATNRAQHFDEFVIPHLKQNFIVVSDRMADSSLAYQGYGRGLDLGMLNTISTWAMNGVKPDLTVHVKLDPEIAVDRLIKRNEKLTAFEKEKRDFTQKLAHGFDTMYKQRDDVITLDGTHTPEQLTEQAVQQITFWLKNNGITS